MAWAEVGNRLMLTVIHDGTGYTARMIDKGKELPEASSRHRSVEAAQRWLVRKVKTARRGKS